MATVAERRLILRQMLSGPAARLQRKVQLHTRRTGLVDAPLILVSQIARSGGTLLSQLFDHHPDVWAHPQEFKIGYPRKWDWPKLDDVRSARRAYAILHEVRFDVFTLTGIYTKGGKDSLPILYDNGVQRRTFMALARETTPCSARDWFNVYLTAFFSGWLDHQRRHRRPQYFTGFASMLALAPESMTRFSAAYPDGWLISNIREPVGWYRSIKKRAPTQQHKNAYDFPRSIRPYAGFEDAEKAYLANVEAMRENARLFGSRFILLDYDALVSDTETVMRNVCRRTGLSWDPALLQQTFNGMPIGPNTSFHEAPASRHTILDDGEVERVASGPMMQAYVAAKAEMHALGVATSPPVHAAAALSMG